VVLSKVDRKILVSFGLIQNLEISDLVMAKVNIAVTHFSVKRFSRMIIGFFLCRKCDI